MLCRFNASVCRCICDILQLSKILCFVRILVIRSGIVNYNLFKNFFPESRGPYSRDHLGFSASYILGISANISASLVFFYSCDFLDAILF